MKKPISFLFASCLAFAQVAPAQEPPAKELVKATGKATAIAADSECAKPFETANWADNLTQLGPVFLACAVDKEVHNKDSDCKRQAREFSRRLIWLPLSLEEMYGQLLHEQRFKEGGILDPDKPLKNVDTKALYAKTLEVFTKVISVLPADQPYRFQLYLVDDRSTAPNAMAMPGGYVYVNLTLAKRAERKKDDEALLAGILAHEIGHVTKRHQTKEIQSQLVDLATGASQLKAMLKGDVSDLKGLIQKTVQA